MGRTSAASGEALGQTTLLPLLLMLVGDCIVFGVGRDGIRDPKRMRGQLLGLLVEVVVESILYARGEVSALDMVEK